MPAMDIFLDQVKRVDGAPDDKVPDGKYGGKWSGYFVRFETAYGSYEGTSTVGIRGVNVPCTVIVKSFRQGSQFKVAAVPGPQPIILPGFVQVEGAAEPSPEDVIDTREELLDELVQTLRGNPERFREILTNKDELLGKMCAYAEHVAEKENKGRQPWSVIGEITGHGSGVSCAIYFLYRKVSPASRGTKGKT